MISKKTNKSKASRKKILLLINSLQRGGSERVLVTIASEMSAYADVKIVTVTSHTGFEADVPVVRLSKLPSMLHAFFMRSRLLKKFELLLEKEEPDAVISFLEQSNIINVIAKERSLLDGRKSYRCVISIRANPSHVYKSGIYGQIFRRLIRKYYPRADLAITNSVLSRKDLIDNFSVLENKAITIYNPIDLEKIKFMASEKLSPEYEKIFAKNKKVIISVGRLTYLKGQERLLNAFKLVSSEVKDTILVLVGGGELEEELKHRSEQLNIQDKVFFLGEQANPFKFIARSDVFAFTSLYEGFPNALIESLACGVPVVSVDCRSGPREILAPKTDPTKETKVVETAEYGILVPPFGYSKDPIELEKKEKLLKAGIVKVLKDSRLRERYKRMGAGRLAGLSSSRIAREYYNAALGK